MNDEASKIYGFTLISKAFFFFQKIVYVILIIASLSCGWKLQ